TRTGCRADRSSAGTSRSPPATRRPWFDWQCQRAGLARGIWVPAGREIRSLDTHTMALTGTAVNRVIAAGRGPRAVPGLRCVLAPAWRRTPPRRGPAADREPRVPDLWAGTPHAGTRPRPLWRLSGLLATARRGASRSRG